MHSNAPTPENTPSEAVEQELERILRRHADTVLLKGDMDMDDEDAIAAIAALIRREQVAARIDEQQLTLKAFEELHRIGREDDGYMFVIAKMVNDRISALKDTDQSGRPT